MEGREGGHGGETLEICQGLDACCSWAVLVSVLPREGMFYFPALVSVHVVISPPEAAGTWFPYRRRDTMWLRPGVFQPHCLFVRESQACHSLSPHPKGWPSAQPKVSVRSQPLKSKDKSTVRVLCSSLPFSLGISPPSPST